MSDNEYADLKKAIEQGFQHSSRSELEQFARIVCLPGMAHRFTGHEWPQVAETVRLMLLVKISEETQTTAMRIANAALVVAIVALIAALPQSIEVLRVWLR